MPNGDIDLSNPESIERYRSYTRYLRQAEEAKNQPAWWKTYKGYMEQADPDHGETEEEAVSCGFPEDVNSVIKTTPSPLSAGTEHVDIGLPYHRPCRTTEVKERRRVLKEKKKNAELERSLRLRTCKITIRLTRFLM